LPQFSTEVAFPKLKFDRPVALAYPNDGSNLLFVVEQHVPAIWSFPNDKATSDKREFLRLPDPINRGNEEGLLGLAFHPKYKENGQFFVYYSANDSGRGGVNRRSVVSRFRVSKDDPRKADPASEERIWVSARDPFENHNGGCIEFGPDGFLYISLGDSGAADDPLTTGQNPKDWFGSILRIDVDHPSGGKPYGIPADNPARRDPKFKSWAPEVFCIGLRNVWKFTFDRENGSLWAGDVGQNLWEMVHIIQNGGNYGWSIREGFHPFQPQRRQRANAASKISPPIVEYPHIPSQARPDDGKSITGGYVYRGKALPDLVGVYVYGDFETGRIWGLREQKGKAVANGEIVNLKQNPRLNIAAFGEDAQGELYILAFDHQIHHLVPKRP
jgi:glucose/arabinose dehydrogenase